MRISFRAILMVGVLLAMILAALAWETFRSLSLRARLTNEQVAHQTSEAGAKDTLSALQELDSYLADHDKTTAKKERAVTTLREAARPRSTDDAEGKDAAYRSYSAWHSGIVLLCPDCPVDGVADQSAGGAARLRPSGNSTSSETGSYGWGDKSPNPNLLLKSASRAERLPSEDACQLEPHCEAQRAGP